MSIDRYFGKQRMATSTSSGQVSNNVFAGYAPGLVLVAIITASAYGMKYIPLVGHLSPMITAIFIGILFTNVIGVNVSSASGIALSGKRLLRLAVALLGLQISYVQLADIGLLGVSFAAFGLLTTFLFTVWIGRILGVDCQIVRLLAAGTSVCGASAIAAASAVTGADDEDVSYAVACITLFGTIAMFLFPFVATVVGISDRAYGLWIGLSVHEVAQVVGAGFQGGAEAGEVAVMTKLARVMMLAPLIICLSFFLSKQMSSKHIKERKIPIIPLFVIGFLVLATANSLNLVPDTIRLPIVSLTPVLLTAAMGALGLGTDVSKLRRHGHLPLVLTGTSTVFISVISFIMAIMVK